MKLLTAISLRFSVFAALILAFWSVLFYYAIIDEVNDETDDSLEDYAELIIRRSLAGEQLPSASSGSNNQYYLHRVTPEYAAKHDHVRYEDRNVYIEDKHEYEPARTLSYIYKDGNDQLFELSVSVPTIEKADLKEAIFHWLLAIYVAIVCGVILLNASAVRRTMRPLHVLLNWLNNYRLGNGEQKLHNPTRISEFRQLNEAVSDSTRRNERLYEQQKMFIGNASHEMQTPLAVCQNRLEMLLEDGSLNEQQMGEIVKTLNTLNSLSKLNRSLLMLCKIDNGQFREVENVDMTTLTTNSVNDCAAIFANRKIAIEMQEGSHWTININRSLAEMLILNLVKNAFLHNEDNGRVVVKTSSESIAVANTGEKHPLDTEKIFTRFYHTNGNKTSTGLGLPIVKTICTRYNISIDYQYEDDLHTFRLSL